ncbi:CheY-P-specific phosphatase CheC [Virgibacillus profundi]|uniref:CheY-P-specific phosphatase CheC n=1 Tax=Virgibacillus profundi TaxID=2024555 RepID=A0A2A2IEP8_9BACI|nr:chemotaxis protein CheC [Virgibacillus profundi]PAV30022.1 CheY-P-specific phosphatase CheC [Virgibacillus profundi]PXY54195.1 chemotaxis protein CheC [Virgibacillus profundi]
MEFTNLTSFQKDALREIGNIGAGNAATSMSKLINKKVDMQVPSVNIVSYDEMMDLIGGAEEIVATVFFRIHGDAPGTVYFILTIEEAEYLISQMTNDPKFDLLADGFENELAISVLQEAGNILTGSYLSALSDFTNINMQPSIPHLSIDMAGAILTAGLLELSQVSDYAIIIDTKINHSSSIKGIHGNFLFLPDPDSFPKIFNALGINSHE